MTYQNIPIDKIIPYARNARTHSKAQIAQLRASLREFGFINPVLIDEKYNCLAGHGRLEAARLENLKEVPVVFVEHLTENQKKAYILADNRIAENSGWDKQLLSVELAELKTADFDTSLLGFDKKELADLFAGDNAPKDDNFDITQKIKPRAKRGDVWQLGRHRLMCGDSTSPEDFARLMNGATAQMAVTSPPYGVGKSYEELGIIPWFNTIRPVIKNICQLSTVVCWNLGDLFPTGGQAIEPTTVYSPNIFIENGFKPIWTRFWKKQGANFGSNYQLVTHKPVLQQVEYIMAFAAEGLQFKDRLTQAEKNEWGWYQVWEFPTVKENKDHPAQFPLELPWRCIKMHSDEGGIVLEPFSGSGTTLLAAEQLGRTCYAMELDPKYVDLAVKRWEIYTGNKGEKI